ncbi:MAG: DUF2938 domain-containing protein [Pseudomonas marincola]
MNLALSSIIIGAGATIVMDLWSLFQKYAFRVPSLNYAMVGRWVGHLPRGKVIHNNIAETSPVRAELLIGWGAHYLIGIIFAGALLAVVGLDWTTAPTLIPPIAIGVLSVAAPLFIMQPCMGAGVAASKTPNPNVSRLRSLIAHTSFGIGLYLSAAFWATFNPL